jgi:hypothetical protein
MAVRPGPDGKWGVSTGAGEHSRDPTLARKRLAIDELPPMAGQCPGDAPPGTPNRIRSPDHGLGRLRIRGRGTREPIAQARPMSYLPFGHQGSRTIRDGASASPFGRSRSSTNRYLSEPLQNGPPGSSTRQRSSAGRLGSNARESRPRLPVRDPQTTSSRQRGPPNPVVTSRPRRLTE